MYVRKSVRLFFVGALIACAGTSRGTEWSRWGPPIGGPGALCELPDRVYAVYPGNGSQTSMYVAGFFTEASGVPANGIARGVWSESPGGWTWQALGDGPNLAIAAFAIMGDDLYAGGGIGPGTACGVAHWDGTQWEPLGNGLGTDYHCVSALAVWNGHLVAGGYFRDAGGTHCNSVAIWDGLAWQPLGSGIDDGWVDCLVAYNGELIVGGHFTHAGGTVCHGIARWTGSAWLPLDYQTNGTDGEVFALVVRGAELIVGGSFTHAGGVDCPYLARWAGGQWHPFAEGSPDSMVTALAADGSTLYVTGDFLHVGSQQIPASHVAQYNANGWAACGAGVNAGGSSACVVGGDFIVGGPFLTRSANHFCGRVAMFQEGYWWGVGGRGIDRHSGSCVYALGTSRLGPYGTYIYAAGDFDAAGSVYCKNVGVMDWLLMGWWASLAQGSQDPYQYNGVDGIAYAIMDSLGGAYVGGTFTQASGVACNHVAHYAGSSWEPMGAGLDGPVYALSSDTSGTYAGGDFTHSGGWTCNHLAQWTGSQWQSVGGGTSGPVCALLPTLDGLVVGGNFEYAAGMACNSIARWDGTWHNYGPGFGPWHQPGTVYAITGYGGQLYAAGVFALSGNTILSNIARWNGTAWEGLGAYPDNGTDGTVYALTVWDGALVIGGSFSHAGGVPCRNLAQWDGSTWQEFAGGANGDVRAFGTVWLWPHCQYLVVGGEFTEFGGALSFRMAFVGPAPGCGEPCPTLCRGDLNCDCAVGFDDIDPFVLAISDPDEYGIEYPNCFRELADMNCDGQVDLDDIEPFVDCLSSWCDCTCWW